VLNSLKSEREYAPWLLKEEMRRRVVAHRDCARVRVPAGHALAVDRALAKVTAAISAEPLIRFARK
jgi:folate-dependent tRNA-U54 methylase TrmFO/GidA